MLCRATQDGWVMVESSNKMWSTGERNGKPFQHSCLDNPMNSIKRQKDMKRDTTKCPNFKCTGRLHNIHLSELVNNIETE